MYNAFYLQIIKRFSKTIKHMYLPDFSDIWLLQRTSVLDLPDLNPSYSSAKIINLLIRFVKTSAVSFHVHFLIDLYFCIVLVDDHYWVEGAISVCRVIGINQSHTKSRQ